MLDPDEGKWVAFAVAKTGGAVDDPISDDFGGGIFHED